MATRKSPPRVSHGIRIGISGWRYAPWRGKFYPPRWPQARELQFASRMLPTIEINGSFYSLQRPERYRLWHDETPADFVFAVKGPRFITHVKRLRDIDAPLANFFASGLFELKAKLGPSLWQFPPNFRFKPELLAAFFEKLPHHTAAALELAKQHDRRVSHCALQIDKRRPLRHAIEVRHESFVDPTFIQLLRRHRVALVTADTAGKWPLLEDLTSDFVYLRLHGDKELYASGYDDVALTRWGKRIETWSAGGQVRDAHCASPRAAGPRAHRDVFCYFDNDVKVHAPYDAARLLARLHLASGLNEQGRFEWAAPPG